MTRWGWRWPTLIIGLVAWGALLAVDEGFNPWLADFLGKIEKNPLKWDIVKPFGGLQVTIIIGLALWRANPSKWRVLLAGFLAIALASLATNLGKKVTRRERPEDTAHQTIFYSERGGGDSMPSGHATTAMANAHILARLYPPVAPIVYTVAVGTGLERVRNDKHFASDVMLGWLVGLLLTDILFGWIVRRFRLEKELFT